MVEKVPEFMFIQNLVVSLELYLKQYNEKKYYNKQYLIDCGNN